MPTYDYQCRSCGNVTEVIHSMTEDGPTTCEVCGGSLRRILYPAGIIFKGSGFYKTDSRSSSSASAAKSGNEAKAGEAKAADGKPSGAKESTSKAADSGGSTSSSTPSNASPPAVRPA